MDIAILLIICISLVIHRHLSTYWEQGILPFAHGFSLFVKIFTFLYFVNLIWLFGFLPGLAMALLTFFQITFASFLWIFLIPGLIKDYGKSDFLLLISSREPSKFLYSGWTYLIFGLALLTILNFFIGKYSSLADSILKSFDGNYQIIGAYVIGVIVAGNILRIISMKILTSK
jgi:hypothetical protein